MQIDDGGGGGGVAGPRVNLFNTVAIPTGNTCIPCNQ